MNECDKTWQNGRESTHSCPMPKGHTGPHECDCGDILCEVTFEVPNVPIAPGEFGQYSTLRPEPIEVIEAWDLPFHEAQVLKYISRWRKKGGVEDLRKAAWFLDRLISKES